jgi:heptosyltransferase-1
MEPRRIALIKPSALGDIVHALPVLGALRMRFPQASITWVVNTSYEPLLAGHPDLTDTLAFDRGAAKRGKWAAVGHALRFARDLRRRRFDLVIDLQGLLRTGLMCLATGAPVRIGFANAREGSRFAYTHRVRVADADHIHAVDRYWRIAESVGAGGRPKHFHVPISTAARSWAAAALAGWPRPIVAVAVGAKWATIRWPPGHFAALLRHVPGTCAFVGAADDTALSLEVQKQIQLSTHPPHGALRSDASRVGGSSPSSQRLTPPVLLDFTGRTTLPQLAALLSAVDLMVGNDTGPLHLAAALGKPCIAPYTCTRVALHGPYDSFAGGIETTVPCGGSYLKTCPNMICMAELSPERLRPQLEKVLERWAVSRSA